jgi:two-component system chemotaxis response regulator CheB
MGLWMSRIVAVGSSQGGVQALRILLQGLPPDFPAPILIVQHIGAAESILPAVLNDVSPLEAAFAIHGEPLVAGRLYVAPSDHHMLVNDGHLVLTRGPRENWSRPAVDPLFRSVAHDFGADAIGIVLSGRLNDGTAGLYEIKRQGGIAIVQTPLEAGAADMPASALDNVPVDYCLPVAEMPRLLVRLAGESSREVSPFVRGVSAMEPQIIEPSAQTCPECGGGMREESLANLTRFRCHIGHVMTAEALAASQLHELEDTLSAVQRRLNERAGLCREIAAKHQARGNARTAALWLHAAEESLRREKIAHELVHSQWVHPEALELMEAGE